MPFPISRREKLFVQPLFSTGFRLKTQGAETYATFFRARSTTTQGVHRIFWYGLTECAVHVHRQLVTSRQLALQCEPQLSCSVGGRKGKATATQHKTCSCGRGPLPALQSCCLRRAFVLQVHVAQREELIGGRPRHLVHEEREANLSLVLVFLRFSCFFFFLFHGLEVGGSWLQMKINHHQC